MNFRKIIYSLVLFIPFLFASANTIFEQNSLRIHKQSDLTEFIKNNPDCTEITGNVIIESTEGEITDISSLNKIEFIKSDLVIRNNPALTTINGFENLKKVSGRFTIENNANLSSLNGFSRLDTIFGTISINNNRIESLDGLKNLNYCDDILITNEHFFTSFENWSKTLRARRVFLDNCSSLNSLKELGYIKNRFGIGLTRCNNIISLKELELIEVFSQIQINQCLNFTSLELKNLKDVSVIEFTHNPKLVSIKSLKNVKEANYINISNNQSLESISGLDSIIDIITSLIIENNSNLKSLKPLNNLSQVGEQTRWTEYGFGKIKIINNSQLKNLEGLEKLRHLHGEFTISNNVNLESLLGLEIYSLTSGREVISHPFTYRYLDPMFIIKDNPKLNDCAISSICKYYIENKVEFSENGIECSNLKDVLANCQLTDVKTIGDRQCDAIFPNPTTGIVNLPSCNDGINELTIFDSYGKVVFQSNKYTSSNYNLSNLSNGLYNLVFNGKYFKIIKND